MSNLKHPGRRGNAKKPVHQAKARGTKKQPMKPPVPLTESVLTADLIGPHGFLWAAIERLESLGIRARTKDESVAMIRDVMVDVVEDFASTQPIDMPPLAYATLYVASVEGFAHDEDELRAFMERQAQRVQDATEATSAASAQPEPPSEPTRVIGFRVPVADDDGTVR